MAFHDQISQAMALHHYTDQQLTDNVAVLRGLLPEHLGHSSPEVTGKPGGAPTWLDNAILRQQNHHHHHYADGNFLHLQTTNSDSSASNQWLSRSIHAENDDVPVSSESMIAMNNNPQKKLNDNNNNNNDDDREERDWQNANCKSDILSHPLYDQLLSAHVSCLRIATPVDQLPRIDAQLAQSQHVLAKYSVLAQNHNHPLDDKDLDQFMTHYVLLLSSFKEQLQQHVRVHAMEAVMACWELEQSLQSLTGVAPGEGTGATMSDDDDDQADSDNNLYDGSLDGPDSMGFGPLVPTESEVFDRTREAGVKARVKQGYKEKIVDIREEILRK